MEKILSDQRSRQDAFSELSLSVAKFKNLGFSEYLKHVKTKQGIGEAGINGSRKEKREFAGENVPNFGILEKTLSASERSKDSSILVDACKSVFNKMIWDDF